MRPPTFVVVGAQRCATTWIHSCLQEHPDVFTATPKELHFFDRHLDRGVDWYLGHFTPGLEHRAWGEATPDYLSAPDAPAQLRSIAPHVRLVCCLREPVARAYSAHQLYSLQHRERGGSGRPPEFEEALERDPGLREGGLYARHLRRWLEAFPGDQLLVLLYDRLLEDERAFLTAIFRHLAVDPDFAPSWLGRTRNAVLLPRLRRTLRQAGLEGGVRWLRGTRWGDAIRTRHHRRRRFTYEPMREATRAALARYYAEPNRELEALLGVDLSAWRLDR
jgi:Sulfotransferase domain